MIPLYLYKTGVRQSLQCVSPSKWGYWRPIPQLVPHPPKANNALVTPLVHVLFSVRALQTNKISEQDMSKLILLCSSNWLKSMNIRFWSLIHKLFSSLNTLLELVYFWRNRPILRRFSSSLGSALYTVRLGNYVYRGSILWEFRHAPRTWQTRQPCHSLLVNCVTRLVWFRNSGQCDGWSRTSGNPIPTLHYYYTPTIFS